MHDVCMQSGCCKPPTYCGFELVNQTTWQMPEKGQAVAKPDCTIWRNDQAQLCFGCQTCKNAVLENIRREWRLLALFNSYVLLSITIISSIGCCALRNNQYGKRHKNYRAWSSLSKCMVISSTTHIYSENKYYQVFNAISRATCSLFSVNVDQSFFNYHRRRRKGLRVWTLLRWMN